MHIVVKQKLLQRDRNVLLFFQLFIHTCYCSHSNLQAYIHDEAEYAKEELAREGEGYDFLTVWEAGDIFSPVFVFTIKAHAAHQHAEPHNKLHVVPHSRFDWCCCVYVLCVRCTYWSVREKERRREGGRERERERKRESLQNGRLAHTLVESTAREGI